MMKDVPYESKFDHFFLILELTTFELINLNLTACTTRAVNVRSIQMEYNASLGKNLRIFQFKNLEFLVSSNVMERLVESQSYVESTSTTAT